MSARRTRLYHRLQLAAHLMQKRADQQVAEVSELTVTQAGVLSVLRTGEGDTQKQIAHALGLSESAMTPMVRRLIRLGFVRKHPHPDDARAWQLETTAAGERALAEIAAPFASVNRTIDRVLSKEELATLDRGLGRLIDAFGAAARPER